MTDIGPLQHRRDSRENLKTVSPAEGEMLISTDEVSEGQVHVGVLGGGPTGGIRIGMTARDKASVKGRTDFGRDIDQTSHVMALNNEWQVGGGGWEIPSRPPGEVAHWPIVQGKLPARTINTGGWIDFHMSGWYHRPTMLTGPGTQDAIFFRIMVGDTYIGPDPWFASEIGWGWPGQGQGLGSWDQKGAVLNSSDNGTTILNPAADPVIEFPDGSAEEHMRGIGGNDCNAYFEFNVRMRCISGVGVPIVAGRDADSTYQWKLTGECEVYAGVYNDLQPERHSTNQTYDPNTATGFERHTKLIRHFSNTPDVNRTNVFRMEVGSPRTNVGGTNANTQSGTPHVADRIVVHNASIIAHGITRGRQIYRTDIGDYKAGNP